MPSKDGWTLERDHDKITLGKKQYRNMQEHSRPCGVCGEKFSIFVRASAPSVNASFGLRTCKDHRGQKLGTAGTAVFEQHEELERLQAWEAVWHKALRFVQGRCPEATMLNIDECLVAGFATADKQFQENSKFKAEIHALKLKLEPYELRPAMEAAKNNSKDFPWGS